MNATVVFEISRYKLSKTGPVLLDRLQLIAEGSALRVRDVDRNETLCKETDIASAINSNSALREVSKGQQAHITCGDDILGQLPTLLEPIPDGASLFVNGRAWDAFPTVDDGKIMLPGRFDEDCAPDMNPCWAEYRCAEGGQNFEEQLVGFSSIGLLAPGIAIERGRTEYGGNGGVVAVSITEFDDFAATFIDWLLVTPILSSFWHGDRLISTPEEDLFAMAAIAADHVGYWEENESEQDDYDDDDSDDEDAEDESCYDEGSFASRCLELHLSQELIDEVRARLNSMNP